MSTSSVWAISRPLPGKHFLKEWDFSRGVVTQDGDHFLFADFVVAVAAFVDGLDDRFELFLRDHGESGPASSIVISPFEQRLHAAAQSFCYNHKAARLAFERLHLTSIGAGPCSHKLHSLAAARASDVLAVVHWNMSPSRNSQGGPLGPETSPSAGTVCNNRAN